MKLQGLPGAFDIFKVVQTKRDENDLSRHGSKKRGQDGKNKDSDDDSDNPDAAISEQEMASAVALFQADPQTRASGLSAATEGEGPGLRVTLRDGQGNMVRQFTGEEFLRLRETVARDQKGRGKILDQKF